MDWSALGFLVFFVSYFWFAGKLMDYYDSAKTWPARWLKAAIGELGFWSFGLGANVAAWTAVTGILSFSFLFSPFAWLRTAFFVACALGWFAVLWYRLRYRGRFPRRLSRAALSAPPAPSTPPHSPGNPIRPTRKKRHARSQPRHSPFRDAL